MRITLATGAAALAGAALLAGPSEAAAPPAVAAMIDRAAATGDPAILAAVVSVAWTPAPKAPPPAVTASPRWKGSLELGGSLAQGANDTIGGYGALELLQAGPVWSHRLTSRGDYQETEGRTTVERLSLAYEPRVRLSESRYVFGLAQYEHDRTLGYANRYTVGAGVGLKVADGPGLKVAVDFGPAIRFAEYYDFDDSAAVAARGSLNIRWIPTERITLSQEGDLYAEEEQASARSITAVETLLFGPLKGRLSYNVHYERNALRGRSALDTTTRASLLYKF